MKINILLICLIACSQWSLANPQDSIQEIFLPENPEYIGYRVALTDMTVQPSKKNGYIKVDFTAINTGRKDLLFSDELAPPPHLVVNFDESIQTSGLTSYVNEIREAIARSDFHLTPGKIGKRKSFVLAVKASATPEPVEEEVVIENLENPRLAKPATKEPEEEMLTAKTVPLEDDFENSLQAAEIRQYDENACSDLVFESIQVIKKTKKKVTLQYTIVNQGAGPAKLINNRKDAKSNMALQAYMSSMDRVTKSSLTIDGDFVNKGLSDSNGRLFPGERYTGTIKLNIQKMTKFTPYLILELDPYLAVYECDKKNNKFAVKVGEGDGIPGSK